ncbi:uncharacterized protein LOC111874410 isoform X2 [Cryptotermes secundus]|uniref:uncharacterized protein LOC111874410 isoform X2 n=1 Tax=Cryptotermes secundus TaxID=105785 RepID=UPI000CD7C24B|nr:uncharacterized protein LOC111874410 isoform X2 [Cryptotermes secundus]
MVALVLVLAVCALCWENLPAIPAGRRAEYYLLQGDGAYRYGYDTGEGQSAVASADQSNQVQGQYSYVDSTGKRVSLAYTAGNSGFLPQLEGGATAAGRVGVSGPRSRNSLASSQSAFASGGFAADGRLADENYDDNADASYSFSIDTDSYKRAESSDARGNIRGQYSYSSREGGSHGVSYIAGEGTGFVVTSSDSAADIGSVSHNAYVPPASSAYSRGPAADTSSKLNNDGSYSFSFSTNDQSREESADSQNNVRGSYSFKAKDDGRIRHVDYAAGSATGFVATGSHLPAPSRSTASFRYPSQGQSRPASFGQSSSSSFSQPGLSSYSTGDGIYSAGDGKVSTTKDASSVGLTSGKSTSSGSFSQTPVGESSTSTGLQKDGSYSFSYNAGDHSRQESGDAQNNVRGSYSFVAKDDGQARHIEYEAGAATGFIAKGNHLPVAVSPSDTGGSYYSFSSHPSVSSYSAGVHAPGSFAEARHNIQDQRRQESGDTKNNVNGIFTFRSKDNEQTRRVGYEAEAGTGFIAKGPHIPVGPSVTSTSQDATGIRYSHPFASNPYAGSSNVQAQKASGGSYSFSYNAGDHSRAETSDDRGNVRGRYSFIAKDDGRTREIVYEAGAEKGFIAKGSHIPVSGYASTVSGASDHQLSSAVGSFGSTSSAFIHRASSASYEVAEDGSQNDQSSGDASYSYSYQTDSSSKEESSDAQGNVVGSFSFLGGDGVIRNVHYTSRGNEGFIVSGENIPKGGSGNAAETSAAFGASSVLSADARSSRTRPQDVGPATFHLKKFLPPESPRKFGYIFDTKV